MVLDEWDRRLQMMQERGKGFHHRIIPPIISLVNNFLEIGWDWCYRRAEAVGNLGVCARGMLESGTARLHMITEIDFRADVI